jgi:hypothetical protein
VDFHEICLADDAIEGDLEAVIFNPVASAMPKMALSQLLK